ncbi:hypothetical protein CsatB_009572 [Cannabis sativa]|uniref:uncharacterized protein LOC115703838 n=1 Tax=Cannabis sativa TaxID=3483 RepID=UPI0011DF4F89|nr:uncharacterized protein LOC115703838 [Cannabis sativa]
MTNRMREVLGHIISDEQGVFLPNCLSIDNALIRFKCINALKKKKRGDGFCALKLDMFKTYGRIEWCFLEQMMVKLGFHGVWICKILDCISSKEYSILLNGEVIGSITPQRGLR